MLARLLILACFLAMLVFLWQLAGSSSRHLPATVVSDGGANSAPRSVVQTSAGGVTGVLPPPEVRPGLDDPEAVSEATSVAPIGAATESTTVTGPERFIRVLAEIDRKPIPGARVSIRFSLPPAFFPPFGYLDPALVDVPRSERVLEPALATVYTDVVGLAFLPSTFSGECDVRVEKEGWATGHLQNIRLQRGKDFSRTVTLGSIGRVIVTVERASGEPVSGVRVLRRGPDWESRMYALDPTGDYVRKGFMRYMEGLIEGSALDRTSKGGEVHYVDLAAGVHSFAVGSLRALRPDEAWNSVRVLAGETVRLTLTAPPLCVLRGRVLEGGKPLEGARVRLKILGSHLMDHSPGHDIEVLAADTVTGDGAHAGEFQFENLEIGEVLVRVSHPTRHMAATRLLDLKVGDNDVSIELSVSTIEGQVLTDRGVPVAGALVRARRADDRDPARPRGPMGASRRIFPLDLAGRRFHPATTDKEGRYFLRGVVPDSRLLVAAYHPRFREAEREISGVAPGRDRQQIVLHLRAGGSLRVTLLQEDRPVIAGVVRAVRHLEPGVRYQLSEIPASRVQVVRAGVALFEGLRPGRWVLYFNPEGRTLEDGFPHSESLSRWQGFSNPPSLVDLNRTTDVLLEVR